MKTLPQAIIIVVLSTAGAIAQWKYTPGDPAKPAAIACDPAQMAPDEVCLATVQAEWPKDEIVWVDARSEAEWKADGIPGSLHLTTVGGANFDEEVAASLEQLSGKRAVVYCGSAACGLSREVVKRLVEAQLVPGVLTDAKVLHGGHAALKGAGLIRDPSAKP